jgi:hypothetical protein
MHLDGQGCARGEQFHEGHAQMLVEISEDQS